MTNKGTEMTDPAQDPVQTAANASPHDRPAAARGQVAMQDEQIAARLDKNPEDIEAQLDHGLDESMDASDPPSALQPGDSGEPLPSSGFDEAQEAQLRSKATD